MGTIQGVNYKRVQSTILDTEFNLLPFDLNGNPLSEMTIEVNTNDGYEAQVVLPEISSFNGALGTTIKVIALRGSYAVQIYAKGSDSIGSNGSIFLQDDGQNAIFTIVNDNTWSVLKTF